MALTTRPGCCLGWTTHYMLRSGVAQGRHGLHYGISAARARSSVTLYRAGQGERQLSALQMFDLAVEGTKHILTEAHILTGTPWYLTIPLIALSVNLVTRLPSTIYSRTIMQRRAALSPIIQAWVPRHAHDIAVARKPVDLQTELITRVNKTTRRIYQKFGVQTWKTFTGVALMPIWLLTMESLRRMSGGGFGLLGAMFGASRGGAPARESISAGESAAPASIEPAATRIDEPMLPEPLMTDFPPGSDPSLATGGCLWFPDLMVPDPYNILPIVLSFTMLANVLPTSAAGMAAVFGTRRLQPGEVDLTSRVGRRFARALLVISLLAGPVTSGMPAAVHLYWISSATISLVISHAINKAMPAKPKATRRCAGVETPYYRINID